jgi:GAF domain-containing protein
MAHRFPIEPFESLNAMFADLESSEPFEQSLNQTVVLAIRAVGCDAGSLSLMDGDQLKTVTATEEDVLEADRAQYDTGLGPCVEAARDGEVHQIPDMEQDHRWEVFSNKSVELGWHSSLSLPLRVEARSIGALNLYARDANRFREEDVEVGSLFASRAAVGIAQADLLRRSRELVEQLKTALQSRDVIGQAKGILMEREGIDSDQAFQMLITASQRANVKLRDVAEELVLRSRDKGPPDN